MTLKNTIKPLILATILLAKNNPAFSQEFFYQIGMNPLPFTPVNGVSSDKGPPFMYAPGGSFQVGIGREDDEHSMSVAIGAGNAFSDSYAMAFLMSWKISAVRPVMGINIDYVNKYRDVDSHSLPTYPYKNQYQGEIAPYGLGVSAVLGMDYQPNPGGGFYTSFGLMQVLLQHVPDKKPVSYAESCPYASSDEGCARKRTNYAYKTDGYVMIGWKWLAH